MSQVEELVNNAIRGNKLSVSKLLTLIEMDPEIIKSIANIVWPKTPKAHIIGVTGAGGVGKSSLISTLVDELSSSNYSIAVLAVDPSSPISGGSLLGDRIRMTNIKHTDKVFIRSMSTTSEEALPLKALLSIEVLDALGYDYIIIETPGVGQFNIGISQFADTVVLVLMPGAGDEVQALKAGIMEIGDIYVINKSDRPDADLTFNQVLFALSDVNRDDWVPRVIKTSAIHRIGIKELVKAVNDHKNHLINTNKITYKRMLRRALELNLSVKYRITNKLNEMLNDTRIKSIYDSLIKGQLNPISAADEVLELMFKSA
ncbi:MAG: methylmalonyl Co-A mutase-associated GTPase MeaB [Sulfolobales archaeon]